MAPQDDVPTQRERQILSVLARGATYEEVASELGISLNTVRTHVRGLYDKLGARSKTEAVVIGLEKGFIIMPGREQR